MSRETIAAIATPVGVGGVGIIRISGPDSTEIAATIIGSSVLDLVDRTMVYGVARDAAGLRLDDVLVVAMRAPRSFTGEDVAEIHGHGGAWNMRRLLREVIARGARHAEAGEFTRRAFVAKKIDLLGAEAMLGVIEAGSERGWRLAQAQLAGSLGQRVAELRARGTELLAEIEASIDFPEDDVDYLAVSGVASRAVSLGQELSELASSYAVGLAIQEGIEVAIVGAVNAGKSSIFNALVGEDRAIVTAEPGTTRDYVEMRAVWQGIPVTLIDTAGARDGAATAAEVMGQQRGRVRADQADLCIHIYPADEVLPEEHPLRALAGGATQAGMSASESVETGGRSAGEQRVLHVVSKIDLADVDTEWPRTSALSGAGIQELRLTILEQVVGAGAADAVAAAGTLVESDSGTIVTTERQYDALGRAASAFDRGGRGVASGVAPELTATDVREGVDILAAMTGDEASEDVLDALFARFCIGK